MAGRTRSVLASIWRGLQRAERRVLVAWIRYAKKNRESNILPLLLFSLLFIDAFVLVIPSMVLVAVSITIQPRRWVFFSFLFVLAVVANNSTTYWMGRLLPPDLIFSWVQTIQADFLWQQAVEAIAEYGKYATLIGGVMPLPTQLVTMLMGMADAQRLHMADLHLLANAPKANLGEALIFGAIGHGVKILVFSAVVRFGWVKLEKKFS